DLSGGSGFVTSAGNRAPDLVQIDVLGPRPGVTVVGAGGRILGDGRAVVDRAGHGPFADVVAANGDRPLDVDGEHFLVDRAVGAGAVVRGEVGRHGGIGRGVEACTGRPCVVARVPREKRRARIGGGGIGIAGENDAAVALTGAEAVGDLGHVAAGAGARVVPGVVDERAVGSDLRFEDVAEVGAFAERKERGLVLGRVGIFVELQVLRAIEGVG